MAETPAKAVMKTLKNLESKKASVSPKSRKQCRKTENPIWLPTPNTQPDIGYSNSWICKNSACRAALSLDDSFCKRCSCCICHLFDDNKDPSLWLECSSDCGDGESCGLSCHIECAFRRNKVGVVDLGQLMQLDGSYCCASCGKVSGILAFWKKQLTVAKEARRVDSLCYRINLSCRLLDGTTRFKELHEIVTEAKSKLESEVGPLSGVSAKMARSIVSRLSVAGDIQVLCSTAIEKADEWSAMDSSGSLNNKEGSLPAACKFLFEEVTSSSVLITLTELSNATSNEIKGYKLWYCEAKEEMHSDEPFSVFPRSERRIFISGLQPCTEYCFRVVSYSGTGVLGHSEAKCFTKSKEIIHKIHDSDPTANHNEVKPEVEGNSGPENVTGVVSDSGFRVRDLGKILQLAWAQESGSLDEPCPMGFKYCCGSSQVTRPNVAEEKEFPHARGLDLNVASVPDLNEEVIPLVDSSRDENNGANMVQSADADEVARSNGSGESENWAHHDSGTELGGKRPSSTIDSDSTLINGSPFGIQDVAGSLDENFEYCVKIIRWLECENYIQKEFRLKLLTWFSLRSTEQQRKVVYTFIRALIDDPSSLAGQLVHSFSDLISCKRPRNGFCSQLWH